MVNNLATLHRSRRLSTAAIRPVVLLGTSLEKISCPQVPISHPDHPNVVVLYGVDYNNVARPEGDIECINITGGYQQVLDITRERCKEGIACVFRSDINRLWVKDLSKSAPMNEDANCIAFHYVDFPPSGRRLSTAGLRPVDLQGTPLQDIAFRHTPEAHPDRSDLVVLYGIDFNNMERPEGDIECINITGGYQQVLDITRERCIHGVICVFRSDFSELWVKELSKSAPMSEDADCIAFYYVDCPSPVSTDGDVDLLLLEKSPEITSILSSSPSPLEELTLAAAEEIITTALSTGREHDMGPLTIAVLDARGNLIVLKREDGAAFPGSDVAIAKAYGALKMTTFACSCAGEYAPVPGGVLIKQGKRILGAVGVTRDSLYQDELCAIAGIRAVGLQTGSFEPASIRRPCATRSF